MFVFVSTDSILKMVANYFKVLVVCLKRKSRRRELTLWLEKSLRMLLKNTLTTLSHPSRHTLVSTDYSAASHPLQAIEDPLGTALHFQAPLKSCSKRLDLGIIGNIA